MSDIAINPVTRRVQFTGNTGTGPYAFTFNVLQSSDIVVYKNNVLLTETTDYTVSIATNGTGNITMVVALVLTDILTIIGGRELSRTTDFVTAGDLLASSLNEQLDSNVIMSQQLDERFGRTLAVPPGDEDKTLDLPLAADRADKIILFDESGNVTAAAPSDFFGNAVLGGNFIVNTATGDGSQTAFGLTVAPGIKTNIQIHIDGVYQNKSTFSLSGSTVTFTEAPPLNAAIEFMMGESVTQITGDASAFTYNQGGTGAQDRTVRGKLQETVSVKDFGAVGDGVTDDAAAIQAAIAAVGSTGGTVFFPSGTFLVNAQIDINNLTGVHIKGAGRDATIIKYGGTFTGGSTFSFIRFYQSLACSISCLSINCDATTAASEPARAILIYESDQITVSDVKATNYTIGGILAYRADYSPNLQKIFIDQFQGYGVTGEASAGIVLTDCDESIVSNTYIKNGTFFGIELKNSCKYSTVTDCVVENAAAAFHIGFQATAEFPDVDGGGSSYCTFENCIAQGGLGAGLNFSRANSCTARNILIDKMNTAPTGATVFTNARAIDVSGSLYCDVECSIFNVNSGVDYALLIDSDDCNVTVSNFESVASTKFARFASGRERINLNILYGDTVTYDTKDLLQDDANSTTNHVYQKQLTDLRLQSSGVLYDYRRYLGSEGHTGGTNYERVTTTATTTNWQFILDGSTILSAQSGVKVSAGTDNNISLGDAGNRWSEVFAGTGTINTSDENLKTNIRDISVAEKAVVSAIKSQMKAFQFSDAVEAKGSNARIHFGVIAQTVRDAFIAEGLDPANYGVFCSDTWTDDDGNEQTRLGIRYDELFAFIISTL